MKEGPALDVTGAVPEALAPPMPALNAKPDVVTDAEALDDRQVDKSSTKRVSKIGYI